MDDLDDLLAGRDGTDDVFADGARADLVDERLDDGQRNVGLDQRIADLAERLVDIGLGKRAAAAEPVEHAAEAGLQTVEHAFSNSQSKTTPGGATRCLGAILGRAQDRKSLGHFRMARVLGLPSGQVKPSSKAVMAGLDPAMVSYWSPSFCLR